MICFIINKSKLFKRKSKFWKKNDALENCLAFQCQETYVKTTATRERILLTTGVLKILSLSGITLKKAPKNISSPPYKFL